VLPPARADGFHIPSVIVHEFFHALGAVSQIVFSNDENYFSTELKPWQTHLYDSFGNQARPGMAIIQGNAANPDAFVLDNTHYNVVWDGDYTLSSYTLGGNAYFQGSNTMEALGGKDVKLLGHEVAGVPVRGFEPYTPGVDIMKSTDLDLRNSLMSHWYYRNWDTLMEAELAILQDIGIPIDRKNFFGKSIYADNGNHDLELGFYARNAAGTGYLPGGYNTAPLSVGLHLYGTGNTVGLSGESLSAGYGGVGIRVDGWRNQLTLNQGTRIHALGENGTGLMVAYGHDHSVTQRGEILAIGPGGVGARFDFGNNILGDSWEYRGSYIQGMIYSDEYGNRWIEHFENLDGELKGPLAASFDLSGTLAGSAAAIYIADNAHVKNINIMNGARLFGDIISDWNAQSGMINNFYREDPGDLNSPLTINPTTALTFGLAQNADGQAISGQADENFFLGYQGNITGAESLKVSLEGGTLAYGGNMDVLSFTAETDTTLLAAASGVRIKADEITLNGLSVGLAANTASYGAPLPALWDVLSFEGDISGSNTIQIDDSLKNFSHGFHDYTSTSLRWDETENKLILGSTHTISQQRAAVSALSAPTAIALQNPAAKLAHDRAKTLFAQNTHPLPAPAAGEASPVSLWVSQGYGDSRRQGGGYALRSPGLALGADLSPNADTFIGAGLRLASPAYRSADADIDAKSVSALVYGGARLPQDLELDAFAAFSHAKYDQKRSAHGERYGVDYSGASFGTGFSLARSFKLSPDWLTRPFASYDFTRLSVEGYNEGRGTWALDVASAQSNLHRVQAGSALAHTLKNGVIEGRLFYSGLYGDSTPGADISMTNDKSAYTLHSQGWPQDKHALGLGLNFSLNLSDSAKFSGAYTFTGGPKVKSHQGEMTLAISF
jgi:uncharacterized protein with beta-barrel porin domain